MTLFFPVVVAEKAMLEKMTGHCLTFLDVLGPVACRGWMTFLNLAEVLDGFLVKEDLIAELARVVVAAEFAAITYLNVSL